MNRREWLKGAALTAFGLAIAPRVIAMQAGNAAPRPALDGAGAKLAVLERRHGGRLGVAILDTGSGRRESYRDEERFLMCSTFKMLLAAAVLERVDRGEEKLDHRIVFGKDALLDYAPVAKQHVGPPGMTVASMCEAAVTWSDNTAANLLLKGIGGPQAVTAYARSLGDESTLLDRYEPALNPIDTTTPKAMLNNMQQLLLGDRLSPSSREMLIRWMVACQTGLQSLRAGVPKDWRVGDKTGQWDDDGTGVNNDIAIAWLPAGKPILVTAYYMNHAADPSMRKAVLVEVGRIIASM